MYGNPVGAHFRLALFAGYEMYVVLGLGISSVRDENKMTTRYHFESARAEAPSLL